MNARIALGALLVLLGAAAGIVGSLFFLPSEHPDQFYDVRLFEVVKLVVTVILAIIATYLINTKLSQEAKRRELVIQLFDQLLNKLRELYLSGTTYMESPRRDLEGQILSDCQDVSVRLSILTQVHSDRRYKSHATLDASFAAQFFRLKRALTDTPFGTPDAIYDIGRKTAFGSAYEILTGKIYRAKVKTLF